MNNGKNGKALCKIGKRILKVKRNLWSSGKKQSNVTGHPGQVV